MTKREFFRLLILVTAASLLLAATPLVFGSGGEPDTMLLDVSVTVTDDANNPIPNAPVVLGSPKFVYKFAYTDVNGVASIVDMAVPSTEGKRFVWALIDDGFSVMPIVPDYTVAKQRFEALHSQYALPGFATADFGAAQSVVSLDLQLHPGCTVQGRVVDSSGNPVAARVIANLSHQGGVDSDAVTGNFVIERVHPAHVKQIAVFSGEAGYRGFRTVLDVDLELSDTNVDVGDIEFVPAPLNASLFLEVAFTGDPPFDFDRSGSKPSLVAMAMTFVDITNPDRIFSVPISASSGLALLPTGKYGEFGRVGFPSGDFIMVLGSATSGMATEVRKAIRGGNVADLVNSGMVRLQVSSGDQVSQAVDFAIYMGVLKQYVAGLE